jgi:hypothetical protein
MFLWELWVILDDLLQKHKKFNPVEAGVDLLQIQKFERRNS